VAAVSLAWLSAKPGVTAPIIGARRLDQLEDNFKALAVKLTADESAKLDALTQRKLGFPQRMLPMAPAIINGGTRVNGIFAPPSGFVMLKGEKPH
jgi:diketogulonate reductase-like aldo/keto reductase